MAKKVIAVTGAPDSGKTTIIRMVYQKLVSKYTITNETKLTRRLKAEISVTLTINGILIGIESQGDPNNRLEDSLKKFVRYGCDVILCARRTKGQTFQAVEKLIKHGYVVEDVNDTRVFEKKNQDASNKKRVNEIINTIFA